MRNTISFNLEAKNEEAVQSILDSVQGYLLSQAFPANIDFNSLDYTEEYWSATVTWLTQGGVAKPLPLC